MRKLTIKVDDQTHTTFVSMCDQFKCNQADMLKRLMATYIASRTMEGAINRPVGGRPVVGVVVEGGDTQRSG